MKLRKCIYLLAVLAVSSLKVFSQTESNATPQRGETNPASGRMITATLTPLDINYQNEQRQFRVGHPIRINLSLTNNSPEPIRVIVASDISQNRLRLIKDGEVVLYRRDLPRRLRAIHRDDLRSNDNPVMVDRMITIPPGETRPITLLDLNHWYDPLEPGQYQLTLCRHFRYERLRVPPVESNTVTFEVIP
jgi:hypothetical protein